MTDIFELDLQKKSLSKIIKYFDQTKKILILSSEPEKYLDILNKNKFQLEIPKIVLDDNMDSIRTIFSNEDNLDKIIKKHDYEIIVLDQILEFLPNPSILLKNISKFLHTNGIVIGCIYNFSNIVNRIKFLDGELHREKLNSKNISFLSLEDILLSLSNSNLKITALDRIKKEITLSNQTELKNYVLPLELIDSINNDPESQTFFYVFSAVLNSNINSQTRKSLSEFSKNLVTEKLNEIFNQITLEHEKEIIYLKQSNQEQYDLIKYLKQGLVDKDTHIEQMIKDKDAYIEQMIKDKDAYIEQMIKDKDAHTEQIIKSKDEIINLLQHSSVIKLLRMMDKLRRKKS